MERKDVAAVLEEIAALLELKGEDKFKVNAYSRAARTIAASNEDIIGLIKRGEAKKIPGVGDALSRKLQEFVETGKISYLEELKGLFPQTLMELFKVPGLGPNKIRSLYEQLDIKSLSELEYACNENRLVSLKGFGKKTQEKVLQSIAKIKAESEYHLLNVIYETSENIAYHLHRISGIDEFEFTGSFRRRKEIVRDLDCVIRFKSGEREKLFDALRRLKGIRELKDVQSDLVSLVWENGVPVEFIIVNRNDYPLALLHSTGSKEFYASLREYASSRGFMLNAREFKEGKEKLKVDSEEEVFGRLGLQFIPPELREDGDAVLAASKGEIPELITLQDIVGLFHVHTTWSDGANSLEEMVEAAKKLGMKYIGLSDHSKAAFYANGLNEDRLSEQAKVVARLNATEKEFHIFHGSEVDILPDGKLDFSDSVLKKLDFVIGSVHSRLSMPKEDATRRIVSALKNPYLTILGHMTGRLLLGRSGYELNIEEVIRTAVKNKKVIEINANPHRLDMDWRHLKKAKSSGIKFIIGPDAHSINGLDDFKYGVFIARKGWLTRHDVINSMNVGEIKIFLPNAKN
ncbi:MAG: DNA polymerase/3'-5' exonuclease PolX [Candidatus Kryptoniota bacterium]